jgi:flagellar hook-length control protein FliK
VAAGPAGLPPAAAQLGHAVATLQPGPAGHVSVRLDPPELGQVQVRIATLHDGGAQVTVAVERPETLATLQADLGHLHQALDRAGVPEQRSLTLHLSPAQDGAGTNFQAGGGGQGAPQNGAFQNGAFQQGGFQQGGRQSQAPSAAQPGPGTAGQDLPQPPPVPAASGYAGIDIMA